MTTFDDLTDSNTMVATANPEQSAAWNGDEGEHWAEHADRYETASRHVWQRFLSAELVGPTDSVLDVGCGTGKSTRDLGRLATDGSVLGIDLSAVMLDRARERTASEGLTNVHYVQGDAQVHRFDDAAFDLAVSSFGAMFFSDPIAAFSNIGRGVAPGGRLALLAWNELSKNEWLTELRGALAVGRELPSPPADAPTPFSLADPDRVRTILGASGYDRVELEAVDEPIEFGRDADDAYAFLRTTGIVRGLTEDLDDRLRTEALANLRRTIEAHEQPDGVRFGTAAWLITARRV
jgi:SAM-dependent methyltransferase